MRIDVKILNDEPCAELDAYFKIREQRFQNEWNFKGYNDYPTSHDRMPEARFLVFSEKSLLTGEEIVFGGRRIIPREVGKDKTGELPFANGKYPIDQTKNKYVNLTNKNCFDEADLIPGAMRIGGLKYCEIGGFAIDTELTANLFADKKEYIKARETIYKKSLLIAKGMGIDVCIIVAQEDNLNKQLEWLKNENYEYRVLNNNSYKAVMKGDKPLILNLSDKYQLSDYLKAKDSKENYVFSR